MTGSFLSYLANCQNRVFVFSPPPFSNHLHTHAFAHTHTTLFNTEKLRYHFPINLTLNSEIDIHKRQKLWLIFGCCGWSNHWTSFLLWTPCLWPFCLIICIFASLCFLCFPVHLGIKRCTMCRSNYLTRLRNFILFWFSLGASEIPSIMYLKKNPYIKPILSFLLAYSLISKCFSS